MVLKKISKAFIFILCLFLALICFCSAKKANAYNLTVYQNPDEVENEYKKENREYAAIPSIEVTGDRIWAAWMSGGDTEPHEDNYITVAYSDDDGATWEEPVVIIDPSDKPARSYNPVLWKDPHGKLFVFWGQGGWYQSVLENPTAKKSELVFSDPVKLNSSIVFNKPIAITNADGKEEYLMSSQNYNDIMTTLIYSSLDQGKTWQFKSEATSLVNAKYHHEPALVEKNDGTLWLLSRIENGEAGGIEQSFSYDKGLTWTTYEYDLPSPLQGPGSRFNIYKLSGGQIVFVTNDSLTDRSKLTIYLSEDDGKTFPYSFCFDDRNEVSYPDIAEDADGNILLIYDKGRSLEQEIRMAKLSAKDIKNGSLENGSFIKKVVSKTGEFEDIVAVSESFERKIEVSVGDSIIDIIKMYPNTINVTTDLGNTYSITGEWLIYGNTSKEGIVRIEFSYEKIDKVEDTFNLLIIEAKVTKNKSSGCSSAMATYSAVIAIVSIIPILIKKKPTINKSRDI